MEDIKSALWSSGPKLQLEAELFLNGFMGWGGLRNTALIRPFRGFAVGRVVPYSFFIIDSTSCLASEVLLVGSDLKTRYSHSQ